MLAAPAPAADLAAEARAHAKALIRLDTSNPPGNEAIAAKYLAKAFDAERVPYELFTTSKTRVSLVARLKGDGSKKPLLLMCHTDVVPAEAKDWTVPPSAAVEKDGYLYGRGAADMKGQCGAMVALMLQLAREKTPLSRDLIFFAQADEESGDEVRHLDTLMKERADLVAAEYAINEGGRSVWDAGRWSEIRVQAAEKQYMDITLTARGRPGHSSRPSLDNAVARLSRAVARVGAHRFPARLNPVSKAFLADRALREPKLRAAIWSLLKAKGGRARTKAADRLAELSPEYGAMTRDTVTPTMLNAGYKSNVIPAEAKAVLNARLLPDTLPGAVAAKLKRVIADPDTRAYPSIETAVREGTHMINRQIRDARGGGDGIGLYLEDDRYCWFVEPALVKDDIRPHIPAFVKATSYRYQRYVVETQHARWFWNLYDEWSARDRRDRRVHDLRLRDGRGDRAKGPGLPRAPAGLQSLRRARNRAQHEVDRGRPGLRRAQREQALRRLQVAGLSPLAEDEPRRRAAARPAHALVRRGLDGEDAGLLAQRLPERVGLRRPDEVGLDEAVHLVRPHLEARPPPGEVEVAVVVLLLAHLSDRLHELQAFAEALVLVSLLEMAGGVDRPTGDFLQIPLRHRPRQGRHVPAARGAVALGQILAHAPILANSDGYFSRW